LTNYELFPPDRIYRGHSYGDLLAVWSNWIVGRYPDETNRGCPCYFLRGLDFPEKLPTPENPQQVSYKERATLKIGHDKLTIPEGSMVFFGVLNTIIDSVDNPVADDPMSRLFAAEQDLKAGDAIPDVSQITIDGGSIKNGNAEIKMEDYLVYSPEFTLHISEATYGTSLAPFFDRPFKHTGSRPAVAAGCFFLVKLYRGNHFIHTFARGPMEEHGVYRTEKLYQIEVVGSQDEAIDFIPQ